MVVTNVHPEDIKAALRKRHGTVTKFAHARGLKPQAVADWFRGRTSAAVAEAIARELCGEGGHDGESMDVDDNATFASAHRLNAGAR